MCCAARFGNLETETAMNNLMKAGLAGFSFAAALVLSQLSASAEDYGPFKEAESSAGDILVDGKGMTLYTFDKDTAGKSNCDKACLKKWPAFHAAAKSKAEGEWTLVKAADGKEMWAYGGKPLYTFTGDKKSGDMNGDGVANLWHVAK